MDTRRNFIKKMAAGTAALSVAGMPLSNCFSQNKKRQSWSCAHGFGVLQH